MPIFIVTVSKMIIHLGEAGFHREEIEEICAFIRGEICLKPSQILHSKVTGLGVRVLRCAFKEIVHPCHL